MGNPSPSRGHAALRHGRVDVAGGFYHLTFATLDRRPWFRRADAARAAAACFDDPRVHGDAAMLAWVLMPDHAHLLVALDPGGGDLASLANRLKSASARHANRCLRRQGRPWNPAYHDRALRREDDVRLVAEYIIANPLRAGLVDALHDYPHWNTQWGRMPPVGAGHARDRDTKAHRSRSRPWGAQGRGFL